MKNEIVSLLDGKYRERETEEAFLFLGNEKLIFCIEGFYALSNNSFLVQRRKKGNEKAIDQLRIAVKVAKLLSWFPYVKGIAVSGSLSKNFADERSDIDFFIITAKNRLWIARTFMHLFKKLTYLAGRQNWFCMNYFVDESALEIKEKNIFTAMEIVTAIPLRGVQVFDMFYNSNSWIKNFFPNRLSSNCNSQRIRKGFLRSFIERAFDNKAGDSLNSWLMNITLRRWQKKTTRQKRNSHGVIMSMDGAAHYCKPSPEYFQYKIIHQFNTKVEQLRRKLGAFYAVKAV